MIAPAFVVFEQPGCAPQVHRIEGVRSTFVAVVSGAEVAVRIVELLNRHGLEDVPLPIVIPEQEGPKCPPEQ